MKIWQRNAFLCHSSGIRLTNFKHQSDFPIVYMLSILCTLSKVSECSPHVERVYTAVQAGTVYRPTSPQLQRWLFFLEPHQNLYIFSDHFLPNCFRFLVIGVVKGCHVHPQAQISREKKFGAKFTGENCKCTPRQSESNCWGNWGDMDGENG